MSKQQLHDELKTLVADIIELDEFGDEDDFVTQLGVDSMLALEIVSRIERRYHLRIPEERFAQMKTLTAVVGIVSDLSAPVTS
jgi:acyl carrier protein